MREQEWKPGPWQAPRIVESRLCRGCDEPCGDQEYCARCFEEVEAMQIEFLEKTYGDQAASLTPAEKLQRGLLVARMRCARWLWVPSLACVASVVFYLGWVFAAAVLEWLEAGGMQ